ncbi:MAG: alanine racemase [Oceanidesulfovibrio sp.]
MAIEYNHLRCIIDLDALCANYALLQTFTPEATRTIPVIKADAYGHGLAACAQALESMRGCGGVAGSPNTYAVGTAEEGATLREAGVGGRVLILLGNQHPRDEALCLEHGLTPVVSRINQIVPLAAAARMAGLHADVAIKFDTGMGRLGFGDMDFGALMETLAAQPGIRPVWAVSHLATADDPNEEPYVRAQAQRFSGYVEQLRAAGFPVRATLLNSAGIIGYPEFAMDGARAGIAMYGANPFAGTAWEEKGAGLRQVMRVEAPVYQVHALKRGESISYGRTFTAPQDMTVAVLGIGYADGYSRGLSNTAEVQLCGRRARIVGRVCMQMTAVDVSSIPDVKPGHYACVLGGDGDSRITAEELAGWWGTITYEVFCLLGFNRRVFVGESLTAA